MCICCLITTYSSFPCVHSLLIFVSKAVRQLNIQKCECVIQKKKQKTTTNMKGIQVCATLSFNNWLPVLFISYTENRKTQPSSAVIHSNCNPLLMPSPSKSLQNISCKWTSLSAYSAWSCHKQKKINAKLGWPWAVNVIWTVCLCTAFCLFALSAGS